MHRGERGADHRRHVLPVRKNPVACEQKDDPEQWEREYSTAVRFLPGYRHNNLQAIVLRRTFRWTMRRSQLSPLNAANFS